MSDPTIHIATAEPDRLIKLLESYGWEPRVELYSDQVRRGFFAIAWVDKHGAEGPRLTLAISNDVAAPATVRLAEVGADLKSLTDEQLADHTLALHGQLEAVQSERRRRWQIAEANRAIRGVARCERGEHEVAIADLAGDEAARAFGLRERACQPCVEAARRQVAAAGLEMEYRPGVYIMEFFASLADATGHAPMGHVEPSDSDVGGTEGEDAGGPGGGEG